MLIFGAMTVDCVVIQLLAVDCMYLSFSHNNMQKNV